jgi:hypothetical protein
MPKPLVTLYHTSGCHLCDEAFALLLQEYAKEQVCCLDIVDDEALLEQYQVSIPVVEFFNGVKLYWPFTLEQIKQNS